MKMPFVSALVLGTVLTAWVQVSNRVIEELYAGARSFMAGQFEAAEQHFQKAEALDSTYK